VGYSGCGEGVRAWHRKEPTVRTSEEGPGAVAYQRVGGEGMASAWIVAPLVQRKPRVEGSPCIRACCPHAMDCGIEQNGSVWWLGQGRRGVDHALPSMERWVGVGLDCSAVGGG
jgi:hypothetical protein